MMRQGVDAKRRSDNRRPEGWRRALFSERAGTAVFVVFVVSAGGFALADEIAAQPVATSTLAVASAEPAVRRGVAPEEIVITARKREERAQEIPLSITAISGSDLNAQHVDDMLDIQFKAPSLLFSKTNFTSSNLQIRGIGAAVIGASTEQAVGVHVNTVPLVATRIFEQEFFDVERVEVLRGPQGTLFGRNSTGGSVNLYTRRPTDQFEADAEVQAGNFTAVRVKGAVNVPISESVRTRFAGMYHRRDGFIENIGTGNDIDNRNLFAVRGSLQIDLTDDLQVDVMASYFQEDDRRSRIGKQLCVKDTAPVPFNVGCSYASNSRPGFDSVASPGSLLGIFESFGLANVDPALVLTPIGVDANADAVNPDDLRVQDARIDPSYFADELLVTADIRQDFDDLTVSLVSGYQRTIVDSRQDYNMVQPSAPWEQSAIVALAASGLPSNSPDNPLMATMLDLGRFGMIDRSAAEDHSRATAEQISTELRFVSNLDGPLNFTAGATYLYYISDVVYEVYFTGAEVLGRLAQLANPQYDPTLFRFANDTRPTVFNSVGVFGEGYWSITDSLTLTMGARYTWDQKSDDSRSYLLDPSGELPPLINREEDWHEPTGRVSLEYKFDAGEANEMLMFISGARGYKPGGFNPLSSTAIPGIPSTFDSEKLWALEVGSKNQLFDRRVVLNVTGFFYDYRDYQISKIVARTAVNENVNALLWGFESELVANPFDTLLLNASFAYVGSRIRDTTSIDTANLTAGDPEWTVVKDLSNGSDTITSNPMDPTNPEFWNPAGGIEQELDGNKLPSVPDVQVNLGAAYSLPAPWSGNFTARVSYYWQSSMFSRIFNAEFDRIDAWSQLDASLRWTNESLNLWIDVWGKNLLDNDDITGQFLTDNSSGNFTNVFLLDPRTFGVTIGGHWP